MSIENIKKFYALAKKDDQLKVELKKIGGGVKDKELPDLIENDILPLAKKRGLDFSADELINYLDEQLNNLSNDELMNVSGGVSPRRVALGLSGVLLLSLGVGGATQLVNTQDKQPEKASKSVVTSKSESKKDNRQEGKEDKVSADRHKEILQKAMPFERSKDPKGAVLKTAKPVNTAQKTNVSSGEWLLGTKQIASTPAAKPAETAPAAAPAASTPVAPVVSTPVAKPAASIPAAAPVVSTTAAKPPVDIQAGTPQDQTTRVPSLDEGNKKAGLPFNSESLRTGIEGLKKTNSPAEYKYEKKLDVKTPGTPNVQAAQGAEASPTSQQEQGTPDVKTPGTLQGQDQTSGVPSLDKGIRKLNEKFMRTVKTEDAFKLQQAQNALDAAKNNPEEVEGAEIVTPISSAALIAGLGKLKPSKNDSLVGKLPVTSKYQNAAGTTFTFRHDGVLTIESKEKVPTITLEDIEALGKAVGTPIEKFEVANKQKINLDESMKKAGWVDVSSRFRGNYKYEKKSDVKPEAVKDVKPPETPAATPENKGTPTLNTPQAGVPSTPQQEQNTPDVKPETPDIQTAPETGPTKKPEMTISLSNQEKNLREQRADERQAEEDIKETMEKGTPIDLNKAGRAIGAAAGAAGSAIADTKAGQAVGRAAGAIADTKAYQTAADLATRAKDTTIDSAGRAAGAVGRAVGAAGEAVVGVGSAIAGTEAYKKVAGAVGRATGAVADVATKAKETAEEAGNAIAGTKAYQTVASAANTAGDAAVGVGRGIDNFMEKAATSMDNATDRFANVAGSAIGSVVGDGSAGKAEEEAKRNARLEKREGDATLSWADTLRSLFAGKTDAETPKTGEERNDRDRGAEREEKAETPVRERQAAPEAEDEGIEDDVLDQAMDNLF